MNVLDCADPHVVVNAALKWPFGWSLPATIEPVAEAVAPPKLVPVPETAANMPWKSPWWSPPHASAPAGSASAAAAASGSRSLLMVGYLRFVMRDGGSGYGTTITRLQEERT